LSGSAAPRAGAGREKTRRDGRMRRRLSALLLSRPQSTASIDMGYVWIRAGRQLSQGGGCDIVCGRWRTRGSRSGSKNLGAGRARGGVRLGWDGSGTPGAEPLLRPRIRSRSSNSVAFITFAAARWGVRLGRSTRYSTTASVKNHRLKAYSTFNAGTFMAFTGSAAGAGAGARSRHAGLLGWPADSRRLSWPAQARLAGAGSARKLGRRLSSRCLAALRAKVQRK
jgi:hypothetical protein